MIGRLRERGRAEMLDLLGGAEPVLRDERANFFGVQSAGVWQWRGNGCLAATDDVVAFVLWLPHRTLLIRRGRIDGVDTTTSHLGKSIRRPLLRIRFENENGAPDAAAWYVADLDRWLAALA